MSKQDIKIELVKLLADGQFHSGEELGNLFGMSRAAIANHMKALSEFGLDIFSVTGRGYKLAKDLSLLDKNKILGHLAVDTDIETHTLIDSTNEYLLQAVRNQTELADGHTVLAECQLAGRGRRGRTWQSPFGSHIYFSQYRIIEDGLSAAAGLSLAVGLAVKKACERFTNKQVDLKWPNDVLSEQKKLAGVLIEAEGQSDGVCHLIVGIGINIDMPEKAAKEIEQPWTDMVQLSEQELDRNQFVAELMNELDKVVIEYRNARLDNLYLEWNKANAFKDDLVNISSNTQVKEGICLGIDNTGALLIENTTTKKVEKIFGGEVSLRKK